MLLFMVQAAFGTDPGPADLLAPLVLLAFAAFGGGLLLTVLGRVVPLGRRLLRSRVSTWRRFRMSANGEWRARAMMDELCPHGWRAEITLFGEAEQLPSDHRGDPRRRVALDWTEFEDDSGRPAVVRRVWAATVGEALEAMVADRRTDETLQQIEQGALAEGAVWPDR
jgi:hypothetical protein